jgi:NitT/TauT family transport system substrate-binding protein
MPPMQTRRRFLTTVSLAGAAGFLRAPPAFAAEGPLEKTTVRIANRHSLCNAPQHVAEELLRAEGFTNIRYIDTVAAATAEAIAGGKVDFSMAHASYWVPAIDAGEPVVLLAGVHVGCFELFAREGIHSVVDLKGNSVGVYGLGDSTHLFLICRTAVSRTAMTMPCRHWRRFLTTDGANTTRTPSGSTRSGFTKSA